MNWDLKSLGNRWLALMAVFIAIALLGYVASNYFLTSYISRATTAVLEGQVSVSALKYFHDSPGKIQAGTPVHLNVKIKNSGYKPSAPALVYIRFAFPKPLDTQTKSLIFETEKVSIDSLEPGQQLEINFKKTHQWPSLFDFVKNDWAMREYQVVVVVDQTETVIGTMSITFSAYYYAGPSREIPSEIPIEIPYHAEKKEKK